MKQAVYVKTLNGWTGDAKLYKMLPPLAATDCDGKPVAHDFVIVSATVVRFHGCGPETYIFPATEDGSCKDWAELKGSYRGGLDHAEALRGAGYEIVTAAPMASAPGTDS